MGRKALLLFLAAASCLLSACASSNDPAQTPEDRSVSSIPWNRPQQWEGQGSVPGMSGVGTP